MWTKHSRAGQATDDNMAHAHCMLDKYGYTHTHTHTHTHTVYIILIAFPLQQWLLERASLLRYTYIACLFKVLNSVCTCYRFRKPENFS